MRIRDTNLITILEEIGKERTHPRHLEISSLISFLSELEAHAFEGALQSAEKNSYEENKSGVYAYIASAQAEAGMPEEAKKTIELAVQSAERITDDTILVTPRRKIEGLAECCKIHAYSQIAVAQAEAEMPDEAKRTFGLAMELAARIKERYFQSAAYESIAVAQTKAGFDVRFIDESLDAFGRITDRFCESNAGLAIAHILSERGKYREAALMADGRGIFSAQAEAEAGNYEEARRVVGNVRYCAEGVQIYSKIATVLAKRRIYDEAIKTLEPAIQLAERERGYHKTLAYLELTSAIAFIPIPALSSVFHRSKLEDVYRLASQLVEEELRAEEKEDMVGGVYLEGAYELYSKLASTLAKAGRYEQAKTIAEKIPLGYYSRCEAYLSIATKLEEFAKLSTNMPGIHIEAVKALKTAFEAAEKVYHPYFNTKAHADVALVHHTHFRTSKAA